MMNDEQFKAELEKRCKVYRHKQKNRYKITAVCCSFICCLVLGITVILTFNNNNKNIINNSNNTNLINNEDNNVPISNNVDINNYDNTNSVLVHKFKSANIYSMAFGKKSITEGQILEIIDYIINEDNQQLEYSDNQDNKNNIIYTIEVAYTDNFISVYKNIDNRYIVINDKYKVIMSDDNMAKLKIIINNL